MKWFEIITEQNEYTVQPKTLSQLRQIIEETIREKGLNCDLNFIDTSRITIMTSLFEYSNFNGDISKWNTSKVKKMNRMFLGSMFDGDISKWNTSNVETMEFMFYNSNFNGDISKWNVSKVTDMNKMFTDSQFNGDISKWNTGKVTIMMNMFADSKFRGDLSDWRLPDLTNKWALTTQGMFHGSPLEKKYGINAETLKEIICNKHPEFISKKKQMDNLDSNLLNTFDSNLKNILKQVEKDAQDWPSKWCDFNYLLTYLENEKNVNLTRDNIKEIKKIANSIFTTYKINGEVYYSFGASKRQVENELEQM